MPESANGRPLISNQPIYNMIERYIEVDVLPVSVANGMGQVVFSPLGQGILTGKYRSGQHVPEGSRAANSKLNSSMQKYLENESLLEAIGEIEAIAHELEITMPQLALAWILRQPGVSSAIIGASRPEQIEDNIKSVDIELTDELLLGINQILLKVSSFKPRS